MICGSPGELNCMPEPSPSEFPREFAALRGEARLAVYIDLKSPYAYIAIGPTRAMAKPLGILLLVCFGILGFANIGAEVLWTRFYALMFWNYTYLFSMVLSRQRALAAGRGTPAGLPGRIPYRNGANGSDSHRPRSQRVRSEASWALMRARVSSEISRMSWYTWYTTARLRSG